MTSIKRKNSFRKDLKLIILAGGKGRLSEETYLKPKPMVKIGVAYSLAYHEVILLFGINEFVATLGYKSKVVKTIFKFKKFSDTI